MEMEMEYGMMDTPMEIEMETQMLPEIKTIKKIKTEDTGKQFEMAICLAYGINYDGPYKYSFDLPNELKSRLENTLPLLFPHKLLHTAKKGARYDFTSVDNESIHLSAKTTKKGVGKVAPQVIGQSQPKKFCDIIGLPYTNNTELKQFIQENITHILPTLVNYTFDCQNIYFNLEKNTIKFISIKKNIDWTNYKYVWSCDYSNWNNSSTLKVIINEIQIPLVEFQFHTKSRTNMVIRWYYENLLNICKDNFEIIDI